MGAQEAVRGELEAAVATVERGAAERMEATERKVAACENEAPSFALSRSCNG